VLHAHAIDYS